MLCVSECNVAWFNTNWAGTLSLLVNAYRPAEVFAAWESTFVCTKVVIWNSWDCVGEEETQAQRARARRDNIIAPVLIGFREFFE